RIIEIHRSSRGTYGAPRIHAELVMGSGIRCSKKRVARLMRQAGIQGVHRRRLRGCTRRNPTRPICPDLVNRTFKADVPDRLWVADLTQHPTNEGFLYLAVVIDAFSRTVVGWSMGDRPVADLVVGAVDMAVWNRRPEEGVIHHSDHGSQYTSLVFSERLREAGIMGSMGSVGDALDNAVAESFFASLQTELLDKGCLADETEAPDGHIRIHRGLLQSPQAAFDPGVSCSTRVRRKVACRAETASISLKTKA
ncbi:MAG TPA: IS3 family transposase, partial [Clostridia bacterium]|nr:IS3 family transposase [Clostridia bacterium]